MTYDFNRPCEVMRPRLRRPLSAMAHSGHRADVFDVGDVPFSTNFIVCAARRLEPWPESHPVGTHRTSVHRFSWLADDNEWGPKFGISPIGTLLIVDHRQHGFLQRLSVRKSRNGGGGAKAPVSHLIAPLA